MSDLFETFENLGFSDISNENPYYKWLNQGGVREVVMYGLQPRLKPFDRGTYSLKKFPVDKMMSILPNVPEKPRQTAPAGSMSGSAHGTSTVSATLGFSVDAEVIKGSTSNGLENQASQQSSALSSNEEAYVQREDEVTDRPDDSRKDSNDWQRVHSVLSPLSTELREGYREALRILLRDGAATERFTHKDLQQKKLAMNWGAVFSDAKCDKSGSTCPRTT